MKEVRKGRTERKRQLGDINRLTMARPPASPDVESPAKRPSRACSSRRRFSEDVSPPTPPLPRTVSKLSDDYALSAERPPPRASASRTVAKAVSLALPYSLPAERLELRSLWEMASVMNFFCVFRHIINNLPEFTMDELESGFLNPNSMLDTIHVVLLKGVPPAARVPLRGDTWPTVLSKKFKEWWGRVADGPCPLVPCQGAELATYLELDPPTRVRVLLALCEMRVDQDDARAYVDDSAKRSQMEVVRKSRSGCGAEGTTFWLEEDSVMGQRLYRDWPATTASPPSKNKGRGWGRGRNVPPPIGGNWETVATNFEEFQEVSSRLLESRSRLEVAMGKKLVNNLMPQLEEIQKKKERMVKKQQREAVLLESMLQHANGLAAGRSRRDRKPVTYTFDEYDRSISEAIKFTKKNMPETSLRRDSRFANGVNDVDHLGGNGNGAYDQVGYVNGDGGVRRSSRNNQAHPGAELGEELEESGIAALEPHLVEAESGFSDDDIVGEAVYDDDYLAAKQRRDSISSEGGESFRGDDQDDADFDGEAESEKDAEDSDDFGSDFRDSDGSGSEQAVRKVRPRRGPKVRLVNDISREGARRSSRAGFDQGGASDDEGSDFGEQIVSDSRRRLRSGGRAESSGRGLEDYSEEMDDVEFEESEEEASESSEASGFSSELRNRKGSVLQKRKRAHPPSPVEEDAESVDHSGEQSVQHSARSSSGEGEQEAGSVNFDEEESMGQEVENGKGSGKRRQLLDLNEVATAARLLSENDESEYSDEEPDHGAEAG